MSTGVVSVVEGAHPASAGRDELVERDSAFCAALCRRQLPSGFICDCVRPMRPRCPEAVPRLGRTVEVVRSWSNSPRRTEPRMRSASAARSRITVFGSATAWTSVPTTWLAVSASSSSVLLRPARRSPAPSRGSAALRRSHVEACRPLISASALSRRVVSAASRGLVEVESLIASPGFSAARVLAATTRARSSSSRLRGDRRLQEESDAAATDFSIATVSVSSSLSCSSLFSGASRRRRGTGSSDLPRSRSPYHSPGIASDVVSVVDHAHQRLHGPRRWTSPASPVRAASSAGTRPRRRLPVVPEASAS